MYDFQSLYKYTKDLKVLYIEDDLNILNETADVLSDYFLLVDKAVNGEEGISGYKKFYEENEYFYDIVITDINMPQKDGITMINEILEINIEQPVIVTSAHNESDRMIHLIDLNISNFIMKPIDSKRLTEVLLTVSKSISNKKEKEKFLEMQSKLASMGKMIDVIAHQWLQPISILKMQTNMLMINNNDNNLTKAKTNEFIEKHFYQIEHLTQTLEEFRSFYREDNKYIPISFAKLVNSVLLLLNETIIYSNISINLDLDESHVVNIIPNEFKHILINLINNSIDAFDGKNIEDQKINISSKEFDGDIVLEVSDNAGGIPDDVIKKIFEFNFTTKEDGSGAGLYLVSQIINKMEGKISVSNQNNGAVFSIRLSKFK